MRQGVITFLGRVLNKPAACSTSYANTRNKVLAVWENHKTNTSTSKSGFRGSFSRRTKVIRTARITTATTTTTATTATTKKGEGYTGVKKNALEDLRFHQYDKRPKPEQICAKCERRFCSCEDKNDGNDSSTKKKSMQRPEIPGSEDCCQSTPQCTFCVWTVYEELLSEFEANEELYRDKLK